MLARPHPVEAIGAAAVLPPEHPAGEQSVKQRLHQRGAEERLALVALKVQPERLFHRFLERLDCRNIVLRQAAFGFAGVAGQVGGKVGRAGDRHGAGHDARKKIQQPLAMLLRQTVRTGPPESRLVIGKPVAALDAGCRLAWLLHDEEKIAVIRHQHAAVVFPIAGDLTAVGGLRGVFADRFHFHRAAEVG